MADKLRRWATLGEAAEHLRTSQMTLRRAIASGRLPARRFGQQIRVDLAEAEQALLQPIPTTDRDRP